MMSCPNIRANTASVISILILGIKFVCMVVQLHDEDLIYLLHFIFSNQLRCHPEINYINFHSYKTDFRATIRSFLDGRMKFALMYVTIRFPVLHLSVAYIVWFFGINEFMWIYLKIEGCSKLIIEGLS